MQSAYPPTSPIEDSSRVVADLIELDPRVRERPGPFEFWYSWTAPPKQPLSASFDLREAARQGRLTSTVLAMVAGSLIILAVPTSLAIHNPTLLVVVSVLLTIVGIALFLNRIGKGVWGRLAVVVAMNASLMISVLTWPGGLTTNTLPIFDIIVVEPTLVALALLPPVSVFVVAAINIIFIGLVFYLQPHSADLVQVMRFDGYEVVTRPLYLLIFIIGVLYPVMRSILRTIALSDRAKEIAKVQHDLADQSARVEEEKRELDQGIQHLVGVLTRAANGDIQIRASLPVAPTLRPIAGSINMLMARVRRAVQSEVEYQLTRRAAAQLAAALRYSRKHQQPLQLQLSGNPIIDEIVAELMNNQSRSLPGLNKQRLEPWRETSSSWEPQ
ncbi:MAG: hypothetical protein H0W02_11350 [Ktedonobacteraceae bacterium]|nr:hypothetical protein [Ktedonobacteraceae bacterium]